MRLSLWHHVFGRFFPFVWASVVLLFVSGYGMIFIYGYGMIFIYLGGIVNTGMHIHVMQGIGIIMMLLFMHLFFGRLAPFPPIGREEGTFRSQHGAGANSPYVATNLVLGFFTIIVGAGGRVWYGVVPDDRRLR